jgi:hypothetical protein
MKRATIPVFAAIVALVLVYPAATPPARPLSAQDIPSPQIITPQAGPDVPALTGDGGDADDLAGAKNQKQKPSGTSRPSEFGVELRLAARVWQIYVFGLRVYW